MAEEIKEERSTDEAGKHGEAVVVDVHDPWVKYMEAKLAFRSKHCKPSHLFTICRVPRDIRSVDNVAYDPLIVSIGPYHRGNPSLHEMEEVKWRNLDEIRDRDGNNFKNYLKVMKEIEPEARACYSGNINMEADEFIEMMLLDGLFIIGFLWKRIAVLLSRTANPVILQQNLNIEEDPIFTITGMFCRVAHDMLLLENQLPFFVLEHLWNRTDQYSGLDLSQIACAFIYDYALHFEPEHDYQLLQEFWENPEMINEDRVHHLLHLVYLSLISPKKSEPTEPTTGSSSKSMEPTTGSSSKSMEPTGSSDQSKDPTAKLPAFIKKILSFLPPRCHLFPFPSACQKSQFMECTKKPSAFIQEPSLSPSKSKEEQPPPLTVIPCAAELDEAGVEFQCVKAKSFLDIKFEQGTMKMPRLLVVDSTKSLLRNFIAYEQCFPNPDSHFTSYCSFMDYLVNTPRDVEILKRSAIIENRVGSDEEVAILFNDLCKGTFISDLGESYLGKSFKDVMNHTQKTWPKWRAKLKHDYFSNPWAIFSLIAATFVIFLTSVQTYKAAFP